MPLTTLSLAPVCLRGRGLGIHVFLRRYESTKAPDPGTVRGNTLLLSECLLALAGVRRSPASHLNESRRGKRRLVNGITPHQAACFSAQGSITILVTLSFLSRQVSYICGA
jgi:hypothetical protein